MPMTFSYIIPCFNSEDTIALALEAVLKNEEVLEVILVDDFSQDATALAVRPFLQRCENISYIRNNSRLGAGVSRNIGAGIAKGDILAFLDADIIIPRNSCRIIEDFFEGNRIKPRPDVLVADREREGLCKDAVSMYKNYWTSYNLSKLKGWTHFLSSSFFAVRKGAFMDVMGFRNIPHAEDNDLGYRLIKNNYKIFFLNELSVAHKKKFNIFSLLKREFKAGKEGIKVKIENRALSEILEERKFFAVNKNFIYSFPFALIFSLSFLSGIIFFNNVLFLISLLSLLIIAVQSREFLAYSSSSRGSKRAGFYILLMIIQLNIIGLGIVAGISEFLLGKLFKKISYLASYFRSFIKLFLKRILPPEQVTFFVTNRCNLNCSHCFVEGKNQDENKELTISEIAMMSRQIGRVKFLTITGGEPFLRQDLPEIVKILNKNLKPSMITILTNGFLTDKITEKINEILQNCKETDILVKVSIDGPAEIHDKMRLVDGSFRNACSTFFKLSKLKDIYSNLTLGVITTYTNQNKFYIEDLHGWIISNLEPDQYGLILERPVQANEVNDSINIDEFVSLQRKINKKDAYLAKGFFKKFRLVYKIKVMDVQKKIYDKKRYPLKCFAGILTTVISSSGDVFACEQLKTKLGNLRDSGYSWRKVWRFAQAAGLKRYIRKKECFCTNECVIPFNLSYDIRGLIELLKIFIKNKSRQSDA